MKKIYSLLLLVISSVSFAQTFYSENMGTPSATTLITAYTGWQNSSPIVYTGTADVRATAVSTGYTGATGGGNVLVNGAAEYFQIDGLNTSAYNTADLQLTFGYNADGNVANTLTLEFSSDSGTTWTPITYTPGATGWSLVTVLGNIIPSTTTLSLRFTQNLATPKNNRLDDIKLSSVSASCTLALGTATAVCDALTIGTDTYTVTIPYTGGGNATYTITPASGVVGGDNPTSVAAGNIVISGIAEGTNFSATVTGGTCNLSTSSNAPECKPINTLPFYDGFSYAEASSLGQSQLWSNVNSGDNIIVAGGYLLPAYPGLTPSTGGYAIFDGAGIDCTTPFTSTNSGTVYYSFLLNVNSMTGVTDVNGGYLATFGSGSTTLGATLWSKRVDDATFNLGVEVRTATAADTTFDTTAYATGQTYFVVVGYTFNPDTAADDTVSLWVNPALDGAQPAATITDSHVGIDLTSISNFLLRQDSTTETPGVNIDELRIGTQWSEVTSSNLAVAQNAIKGLKIYPNPVSNGTLFIETTANATKSIVIYDVLGKQVLSTTTANNAISVSSLRGGVYVVKITEEGKTATRKLVIK